MFVIRAIVFTAIVLVGLSSFVLIYPQYTRREKARADLAEIENQCDVHKEELQKLRILANGLDNSPVVIDRVARELLGFSAPGDVVVKFVDHPATKSN